MSDLPLRPEQRRRPARVGGDGTAHRMPWRSESEKMDESVRSWRQLRAQVTFARPLPFVPKPMTVLWTDLINCQYMGIEDVTLEGCTLTWEAPEPGRCHVKPQ